MKTVDYISLFMMGKWQFYHGYHIHKVHGISSDISITKVKDKMISIKELATYRKYSRFGLFGGLELRTR